MAVRGCKGTSKGYVDTPLLALRLLDSTTVWHCHYQRTLTATARIATAAAGSTTLAAAGHTRGSPEVQMQSRARGELDTPGLLHTVPTFTVQKLLLTMHQIPGMRQQPARCMCRQLQHMHPTPLAAAPCIHTILDSASALYTASSLSCPLR